jgi:hypothetical protein
MKRDLRLRQEELERLSNHLREEKLRFEKTRLFDSLVPEP